MITCSIQGDIKSICVDSTLHAVNESSKELQDVTLWHHLNCGLYRPMSSSHIFISVETMTDLLRSLRQTDARLSFAAFFICN